MRTFPLNFGVQRFATDLLEDGRNITVTGFSENDDIEEAILQVAHVEEILYQSLFASYSNIENDGNPFYAVIIPPNNIEGENVYCVFAGFQLTEKTITANPN